MKRVCVYTNGKVFADVVCGSLSEYQENGRINDKNSQQKMKLCTKGGRDLLNRRIEGWGEKEERWPTRLFQARSKV